MTSAEPDFISLREVLLSVAGCVTVPSLERCADTNEPEFIPQFREALFRYSTAADDLERHITLASSEDRPTWLDCRVGMGTPRVTEEAQSQGLSLLRCWAGIFPEWTNRYQSGQWVGSADGLNIRFPDLMYINVSNMNFVQQVGFERISLIQFLKTTHIQHALTNADITGCQGKKRGLRMTCSPRLVR